MRRSLPLAVLIRRVPYIQLKTDLKLKRAHQLDGRSLWSAATWRSFDSLWKVRVGEPDYHSGAWPPHSISSQLLRLIETPPLVVDTRTGAPPEPRSIERSFSMRPCTVIGKPTFKPPLTVLVSSRAE